MLTKLHPQHVGWRVSLRSRTWWPAGWVAIVATQISRDSRGLLVNSGDVCLQSTPFASLFEKAADLSNATKRQELFDAAIFEVWCPPLQHQDDRHGSLHQHHAFSRVRACLTKRRAYAGILLAVEAAFSIDSRVLFELDERLTGAVVRCDQIGQEDTKRFIAQLCNQDLSRMVSAR